MAILLHLDASARINRSITRDLTKRFVSAWRQKRQNDKIIVRDVGRNPPDFISEAWITACFTPQSARTYEQNAVLAQSDELIGEVRAADLIVMGAPMYNYGMPAALKAWFDQVVRVGETFSFDLERGDWPLAPILSGKALVVISSRGEFGFAEGGIRMHMNQLDPHIYSCAHYLGVQAKYIIAVEYQEFGDERHLRSRLEAEAAVDQLVTELVAGNED